jgi:hypothetical protein
MAKFKYNPEQFDSEGYRIVQPNELSDETQYEFGAVEYLEDTSNIWYEGHGNSPELTYRTKLTRAELKAKLIK